MGESKRKREVAVVAEAAIGVTQVVDTQGGRMHVRWDEGAAATPHGQLVFFAEFLATNGRVRSVGVELPAGVPQRQRPGQRCA